MGAPRSTTKQTIQAYTSWSEVYLKEWHRRTYRIPLHLKIWIENLPPRSLVLDLGCGPGQDSRHLRRRGFHVVGLDLTQPFLQRARRRSPKLPLVQADIEHLPFSPETFDGIWAAASLIHLPKTTLKKVLRQVRALLRPSGLFAATFLHGKGAGLLPGQWIPGRYMCKWLKPELQEVFQQGGWDIISLQTVSNRERKGRWLNVMVRREA